MQRRVTTQDVTWLLDLNRNGQLNLDPPYQRRSVWTRKDRQFFLDTIFRNYPSPAIFLHKSIDDVGNATYHVVDGKQRIETIIEFVNNKVRLASDFGDVRLDGKLWRDLEGSSDLKQTFWNYQVTVEMIDVVEGTFVNEVFDRLNRNSRKLTNQELRHAKFDGWFITEVESEASRDDWRRFGVVSTARSRRMADLQFISELLLVLLENQLMGFDQNSLDTLYAKYEEPQAATPEFDEDDFRDRLLTVKDYLKKVEAHNQAIERHAKALANFYTLWGLVALNKDLPDPTAFAEAYSDFMTKVERLTQQDDLGEFLKNNDSESYRLPLVYLNNNRGATTDIVPRQERHKALRAALPEE